MQPAIILILENIRSTENVGAMFRTADAAGVSEIYLVGYTPGPLDRFGRARKDIAKAALGAEETVVWKEFGTIRDAIAQARKSGFTIVALEQDPRAIPYTSIKKVGLIALIVGNEVDGVSTEALDLADTIISIPMLGKKESLNVSVATGIALFQIVHSSQ